MNTTLESHGLIRLLIADDQAIVREGLTAILTPRRGMDIIAQAANGQEAVTLFHECHPDITLMDLRMPHMDGLTATRAILAESPNAQIIVLTSFAGEEDITLRAGAKAIVLKDALYQELLDVIHHTYNAAFSLT